MLRICLIGGLAEALARIYWDHEHAVANGEWALWSQHESALFWFGHCSLTTLNRPCGKGPGKKRSCPQRRSHFCDPWISMICSVCPANFTVPCVPGSNLTTSHQPPPAHGYSSGHLATACDKVCSYGKTYSRSSRPVTTTEAWNQKGWRDLHSAGLCSHRVTLGRGGCWVCSKSWPPVTRRTYLESSIRSCFPGWWQVLPIRQQGANLCSADLTQCKLGFKVIGANKAICWQISSESYKCCPSSGSDSLR